uniref:Extensin-like n=1 Tax=Drosophila rhopaloa TaxID=1041015 RepID=A0A6P4E9G2_DRORH
MFLYTRRLSTFVLVVALILLALTTEDVHAKRNSKSSGSSRSTSSRKTTPRTTKAPPRSYLAPSHRSAPSNHAGPAHHSVPAHRSKSDNERLSYGGGKESKVFNPQTVPSVTTSPFGRNAPAQPQGPPPVSSPKEKKPPPFYTPPTHKNGRPNIHSPSRPAAGASPSSRGSHYGAAHSNTGHRGRNNSTGKYGSSGGYQPIKATNAHKVQSSYPREQLPPGATYHPAGQIPAGATYHPAGQIPAGATYHPPGQIPAGATFHPAAQIPAGASYQTAGQVPHGATLTPAAIRPEAHTIPRDPWPEESRQAPPSCPPEEPCPQELFSIHRRLKNLDQAWDWALVSLLEPWVVPP